VAIQSPRLIKLPFRFTRLLDSSSSDQPGTPSIDPIFGHAASKPLFGGILSPTRRCPRIVDRHAGPFDADPCVTWFAVPDAGTVQTRDLWRDARAVSYRAIASTSSIERPPLAALTKLVDHTIIYRRH